MSSLSNRIKSSFLTEMTRWKESWRYKKIMSTWRLDNVSIFTMSSKSLSRHPPPSKTKNYFINQIIISNAVVIIKPAPPSTAPRCYRWEKQWRQRRWGQPCENMRVCELKMMTNRQPEKPIKGSHPLVKDMPNPMDWSVARKVIGRVYLRLFLSICWPLWEGAPLVIE